MRRGEARIALEAARRWNQRGMFKDGAYGHIERELGPLAAEGEPSLGMQALYAIGGVMLGAASAALFALLDLNDIVDYGERSAWAFFSIFAFLFLGIAVGIHMTKQRELGDALIIAGLVPTAILMGPEGPHEVFFFVPGLIALSVMVWRRSAYLVPLLGVGLASVGVPLALFQTFGDFFGANDTTTWLWFLFAVLFFAAVLVWSRMEELRWGHEGAAATALAAGIAWITLTAEVIRPTFDGGEEVIIALMLGAILAVGILLKEQMTAFVAGIGLAIDAIVFAFDIGGPEVGLVVLLVLAAGLITGGTLLRRQRQSSRPAMPRP